MFHSVIPVVQDLTALINNIVTPFAGYYMCHHYIGSEITRNNLPKSNSNNLLANRNYSCVKAYDIIYCQVDLFESFYDNILPNIKNKFVLITGQAELPMLQRTSKTDALLTNDKLIAWFAQNPIYCNHPKYMPFPYGVSYAGGRGIREYANNLLKNEILKNEILKNENGTLPQKVNSKVNSIVELPLNYGTNKCRLVFKKQKYLQITKFYEELNKYAFVFSPIGDRDDCYRHWEAIGFGTVPISNVSENYKPLFKDNMIYVENTQQMLDMTANKTIPDYKEPNKELILVNYWRKIINEKINNEKLKTT